MIKKITPFLLILFGVGLLVISSYLTYFTLAGGVERETVANGTTTYGGRFTNLMFGFEIFAISAQTWLGIVFIGMAIYIAKRK
jgi:hypothetical protein